MNSLEEIDSLSDRDPLSEKIKSNSQMYTYKFLSPPDSDKC